MCAMKPRIKVALSFQIALAMVLLLTGCRLRRATDKQAGGAEPVICTGAEAAAGGCDVVLEPYPRYDDPDAMVFDDLPVKLFFFPQTPPAGTEVLRPIRAKAALPVARGDCRETGVAGLKSLQRLAVRHRADAVVNIRATWDGDQLGDELSFGCRRVGDRWALIWEGALARVPAQVEPADPVDGGATGGDQDQPGDLGEEEAAKLRKLQNLYYQGLITREEFLQRRQDILNEL